ncbi:unnamed protein product [Paramecium pentaurelia]|uniref:Transmembrane protein n=1 Tax=Paramecium pentaurelia TaxID=43138 RepID=A0A8S1WL52_9CILI|nr:unnamed protein product [Paramecium pentaurelia]
MVLLINVILLFFHLSNCEWTSITSYLTQIKTLIFRRLTIAISILKGLMKRKSQVKQLQILQILHNTQQLFIISLILQILVYCGQIFFITFDLIFFGIWNELENLTYSINNQKYAWIYNNFMEKVEIQKGFCDSKQAFIQSANFTINQTSAK